MIFGVLSDENLKSDSAHMAFDPNGPTQKAIRSLKKLGLFIMTDVCLCGFTKSGHCGMVNEEG